MESATHTTATMRELPNAQQFKRRKAAQRMHTLYAVRCKQTGSERRRRVSAGAAATKCTYTSNYNNIQNNRQSRQPASCECERGAVILSVRISVAPLHTAHANTTK